MFDELKSSKLHSVFDRSSYHVAGFAYLATMPRPTSVISAYPGIQIPSQGSSNHMANMTITLSENHPHRSMSTGRREKLVTPSSHHEYQSHRAFMRSLDAFGFGISESRTWFLSIWRSLKKEIPGFGHVCSVLGVC